MSYSDTDDQLIQRTYYLRGTTGDVTFYIQDQLPTNITLRVDSACAFVTPRTVSGTITGAIEVRLYGAFSTERIYDAVISSASGTSPTVGGYIILGYFNKDFASSGSGDSCSFTKNPPIVSRAMSGPWRVQFYDIATGTTLVAAKIETWGVTLAVRAGGEEAYVN